FLRPRRPSPSHPRGLPPPDPRFVLKRRTGWWVGAWGGWAKRGRAGVQTALNALVLKRRTG
ncbi:hypothetical protein, partial [Streptomyces geranii]|uniref:hypothetical protein n=1 Tax=Streptomyces geranii TaxID=2058923 RepID=UPI001E5B167A